MKYNIGRDVSEIEFVRLLAHVQKNIIQTKMALHNTVNYCRY